MWNQKRLGFVTSTAIALTVVGCHRCLGKCDKMGDITPKPLGALSDPTWQKQEHNAEASDFVVHEHEFTANTARLNAAGEQHVKQIALRFNQKADLPYPVLIEPSSMSVRPGDKYGFAVHNDPALDINRRQVIVASLQAMGLTDAEQKVVVSPALTPGFTEFQSSRAYGRSFGSSNTNTGGAGFGAGGVGGNGGGFF